MGLSSHSFCMVVHGEVLLPHSTSIPGSILNSGSCLCRACARFPLPVRFLEPPQNMHVS